MYSYNALIKLFTLSQDFIFSLKLFDTLTPILDKQYCLLVVRVYFSFKFFFLVLYSFPEKLLVKHSCISCGNLLLNSSYINIQVCNVTSWNIVNILRLRNNFEISTFIKGNGVDLFLYD